MKVLILTYYYTYILTYSKISSTMTKISYKYILLGVITFAFIIRFVGIKYGLPLWLIGDEPPFTTATLKMIELKNLLPVLDSTAFESTLYFPPYLSYIYLIPFTILLGIKYLLFDIGGNMIVFKNYIVSDLSHFFILARIISVMFGTATVWLIYKTAKNIFQKEWVALFSAFFLATSTLHIYLSSVARDWVPALFFFVLVMWILSNPNISFKRKYILGAIISGFTFGISLISAFSMLFMLFWYLFYEKNNFFKVFKEKTLYISLFIFLALSAISVAIYPFGFHLSAGDGNSLMASKSLIGYISNFAVFLKPIFISEPILMTLAVIGAIFSFKNFRNYFLTGIIFIFSYITIYYIAFWHEQRFTIYFFPIISIFAGYGLYVIGKKISNKAIAKALVIIILLIPLTTSIRLEWLILRNDSRIQAREWVEKNIEAGSKILIYAEMTRLASIKESYLEQKSVDSKSLRKVDEAEASFDKNPHKYTQFHALNLYDIVNDDLYENLAKYAKTNNYQYFVLDPFYRIDDKKKKGFSDIIKSSTFIKSFGQPKEDYLLRDGDFGDPIGLFKLESFGPLIKVYKLNNE